MEYSARQLDDGSYEFITKLTQEEMDDVMAKAVEADTDALDAAVTPKPLFLGISFERKTDYCVTCLNGNRQTIWAYGDMHAFIYALNVCGPGFSMHKGSCIGLSK